MGAGKTSLVNLLAQHTGFKSYTEIVDNDLMSKYYNDVDKINKGELQHSSHVFLAQMQIIKNRNKILDDSIKQDSILDGSLIDDKIFVNKQHEQHIMNDREYQTYLYFYNMLFIRMQSELNKNNTINVFIESNDKQILHNIYKRSRDYETNELNKYYLDIFHNYQKMLDQFELTMKDNSNFVHISNEKDFVNNKQYQQEVLSKIDTQIKKLQNCVA